MFKLDIDEALSLINYAFEKQEEELLYLRWVHDVQFQISFEEFKIRLRPQIVKNEAEILKDVEDIITLFNKGRGYLL